MAKVPTTLERDRSAQKQMAALLLLLALLTFPAAPTCRRPGHRSCGFVRAARSTVAERGKAFHGYSEKAASQHESAASGSTTGSGGSSSDGAGHEHAGGKAAPCRDANSGCPDWASKVRHRCAIAPTHTHRPPLAPQPATPPGAHLQGECEKNAGFMSKACPMSCKLCRPEPVDLAAHRAQLLVLRTPKGDIRVTPQWATAPKTAALVMDLAAQQDEALKGSCRFYRNEAIPPPEHAEGPPYGLLQGSLAGVPWWCALWCLRDGAVIIAGAGCRGRGVPSKLGSWLSGLAGSAGVAVAAKAGGWRRVNACGRAPRAVRRHLGGAGAGRLAAAHPGCLRANHRCGAEPQVCRVPCSGRRPVQAAAPQRPAAARRVAMRRHD